MLIYSLLTHVVILFPLLRRLQAAVHHRSIFSVEYPNTLIFGTFSSQEEFDKLEKEAFDPDLKKFIHAITIAKTYLKGLKRVNEIKLEEPYISSVLVGFAYYGNCASISFQSLRSFLVQKGEIDEHDITSSFFASIFLKVSTSQNGCLDYLVEWYICQYDL